MATASDVAANDRLFCWEQVQRVNPLFRLSHLFAPRDLAPGLLALHALYAAIEESCSGFSDEHVARQKLAWWRQEALGGSVRSSSHPVLRSLARGGGSARLATDGLTDLLDQAEQRIDAPPPADLPELLSLAGRIARPQVVMEAVLCSLDPGQAVECIEPQMAGLGMAQLVREASRGLGDRRFWWLPLSLQARHGVSRTDVLAMPESPPVRALFRDLLESAYAVASGRTGLTTPAARHLQVSAALNLARGRRLARVSPASLAVEIHRVRIGDAVTAWRAARRFSRP